MKDGERFMFKKKKKRRRNIKKKTESKNIRNVNKKEKSNNDPFVFLQLRKKKKNLLLNFQPTDILLYTIFTLLIKRKFIFNPGWN